MIEAKEFKSGLVVNMEGRLYVVVSAQHYKPGKGGAIIRTKLRDLNSGNTTELTLRPEEKYEEAFIDEKKLQYLYHDGDLYHFMDTSTYDQLSLGSPILGDAVLYLKDDTEIIAEIYKGKIIGIKLPTFMVLKVEETEPGFKGDTSKSGMKPATLETGAKIQVPLFVNTGDIVKVDTRTGEYVERV